jgi:CheY-like chemotaxis protein
MDYLSACVSNEVKRLPDLILLDLNMPLKDGHTALLEIKSNPAHQNITIVILTTSNDRKDKQRNMKAGADSFITKPMTYSGWVETMNYITRFWLRA